MERQSVFFIASIFFPRHLKNRLRILLTRILGYRDWTGPIEFQELGQAFAMSHNLQEMFESLDESERAGMMIAQLSRY